MISLKDHFHLFLELLNSKVAQLETNMKRFLSHLDIYYLNYNHA